MKISSPSKIQELRNKRDAINAIETAISATTSAHLAATHANVGNCAIAIDTLHLLRKEALKAFNTAYNEEQDGMDDDSAHTLHVAVWG